jgi:hypothetical protein
MPHRAHQHEAELGTVALNAQSLEDEKVASAIKTDFILSAEIMAITLAAHPVGEHLEAGACACGRGHRHHRRRVWRGRADRESRRRGYGACEGAIVPRPLAARSDAASFAACPGFLGCSAWSAQQP